MSILDFLQPSPEQRRAVEARGHDIVVTAGAGAGKTRTLVARYLSLLDEGPRSATVTAKGDVVCLAITRTRFTKLLRSEPSITIALLTELSRRLRAAQATA